MYGASGTASDLGVGYLRTYLQARFGAGGIGFVPLVPLSSWYRHGEVKVTAHRDWTKEHVQIAKSRLDGHYGYLGASFFTTKKGRWASVMPAKDSPSADRIDRFEIHALGQPGGGSMVVKVDGKRTGTFSTAAEVISAVYHLVEVEPGRHSLRIETLGDGEVRLFGVVIESDTPGVVVDTLGIDGTRGTNLVSWSESVWGDAFAHRSPDLVALSYGTNESVDDPEKVPLEAYRDQMETVLDRLRRLMSETASCVLVLPTDYPIVEGGDVRPRPRLLSIVEIQRELGPRHGCGVWDGLAFMGGPGTMGRFVAWDPPLAKSDHLHFTRHGSARKSQVFTDALMAEYDAPTAP
jgi:hypothetical protein